MKKILFIVTVFLFFTCNKDDVTPTTPGVVKLIFPFENSDCNVGTDSTDTESDVIFEWAKAENTDEYELNIVNLSVVDTTSYTTSELQISVRLNRATPYSWYIISKLNSVGTETKSDTWRFYNAGIGVTSFAPFPANIISPEMSETISNTTNVTLSWEGNDVDNDIIAYDIYFGTVNPPEIIETDFKENSLNNVSISANTVYYWKIITKDSQGNSSDSGIYQFKTQ